MIKTPDQTSRFPSDPIMLHETSVWIPGDTLDTLEPVWCTEETLTNTYDLYWSLEDMTLKY